MLCTDFAAWYRVVSELPGVGFYNSAAEAGASQRHKHMQVRYFCSFPAVLSAVFAAVFALRLTSLHIPG